MGCAKRLSDCDMDCAADMRLRCVTVLQKYIFLEKGKRSTVTFAPSRKRDAQIILAECFGGTA